jgi:hypothetical protein
MAKAASKNGQELAKWDGKEIGIQRGKIISIKYWREIALETC